MSSPGSGVRGLLAEIRKRKVHTATIAYLIVAWLLIEISSVVFPALLLPEWSHRLVVVLAIIGLPVVWILAWIFDLTPHGVERTTQIQAPDVQRSGSPSAPPTPPAAKEALASIVVLPFEALSPDPEDGYLAEGISVEVSRALSRLPDVRVIHRPSTQAARSAASDIGEIGRSLEARYVLSGNVRRSGEHIRVVAELSDAREGVLLWSETYDPQPADLLEVEEDIASAIAASFGGQRLLEDLQLARQGKAQDLGAWSLVNKARAYLLSYSRRSLDEAETLVRRAVELDPGYAGAHAALASILSERLTSGLSESPDQDMDEAIRAAKSAVDRAPQDPFVLKLAGSVWSYTGHQQEAIDVLRRVVEMTPFDFGAWGYLAWSLATSGETADLEEAHAILDRILEMAPQHPGVAYWMHHKALAYTCEGRFAEAAEFAKRAVDRQPNLTWAWFLYANALADGDVAAARAVVERAGHGEGDASAAGYVQFVCRTSPTVEVRQRRLGGLEASGLL